jgi:hypothetical protein
MALHDFAAVQHPDVVEFDYADGSRDIRVTTLVSLPK